MKLTILSDECIPNCPHGSKCGRCTELFGSDKGKDADVSTITKSLDDRHEPYRVQVGPPAKTPAGQQVTQVLVAPVFTSEIWKWPKKKKRT